MAQSHHSGAQSRCSESSYSSSSTGAASAARFIMSPSHGAFGTSSPRCGKATYRTTRPATTSTTSMATTTNSTDYLPRSASPTVPRTRGGTESGAHEGRHCGADHVGHGYDGARRVGVVDVHVHE